MDLQNYQNMAIHLNWQAGQEEHSSKKLHGDWRSCRGPQLRWDSQSTGGLSVLHSKNLPFVEDETEVKVQLPSGQWPEASSRTSRIKEHSCQNGPAQVQTQVQLRVLNRLRQISIHTEPPCRFLFCRGSAQWERAPLHWKTRKWTCNFLLHHTDQS